MKTVYEFGDKLYYKSAIKDDYFTPCVFVRYDDNGRCVVIFEHAEWCARVNPTLLHTEMGGKKYRDRSMAVPIPEEMLESLIGRKGYD